MDDVFAEGCEVNNFLGLRKSRSRVSPSYASWGFVLRAATPPPLRRRPPAPAPPEITLMYLILSSQLPSYIFLNDLSFKCYCTYTAIEENVPFLALLFNTRAFFILTESPFFFFFLPRCTPSALRRLPHPYAPDDLALRVYTTSVTRPRPRRRLCVLFSSIFLASPRCRAASTFVRRPAPFRARPRGNGRA